MEQGEAWRTGYGTLCGDIEANRLVFGQGAL